MSINSGGDLTVDAHILEFYDSNFSNDQPIIVLGSNSSVTGSRIAKAWDDVSNSYLTIAISNTVSANVEIRNDINLSITGNNLTISYYANRSLNSDGGFSEIFDMESANVTVNSASVFNIVKFGHPSTDANTNQNITQSLVGDTDTRDLTPYRFNTQDGTYKQWNNITYELEIENSLDDETYVVSETPEVVFTLDLDNPLPSNNFVIEKVGVTYRAKRGVSSDANTIGSLIPMYYNGIDLIEAGNNQAIGFDVFNTYKYSYTLNPINSMPFNFANLDVIQLGLRITGNLIPPSNYRLFVSYGVNSLGPTKGLYAWDSLTGFTQATLSSPPNMLTNFVAVNPNGLQILTGHDEAPHLVIRDLNGNQIQTLTGASDDGDNGCWTIDGNHIIVAYLESFVQKKGRFNTLGVQQVEIQQGGIATIIRSNIAGSLVAMAETGTGQTGFYTVSDPEGVGYALDTYIRGAIPQQNTTDLSFSPDGTKIALTYSGGVAELRVFDSPIDPSILSPETPVAEIFRSVSGGGSSTAVAYHPTLPWLAIGRSVPTSSPLLGTNTSIHIASTDDYTTEILPPLSTGAIAPKCLQWSPDGRYLASALGSGAVIVYDRLDSWNIVLNTGDISTNIKNLEWSTMPETEFRETIINTVKSYTIVNGIPFMAVPTVKSYTIVTEI